MYDFENNAIDSFSAYVEKGDRYVRQKAVLKDKLLANQKPCPSALCYYCDFGLHKKNLCPYSSNWDPSKKRKK